MLIYPGIKIILGGRKLWPSRNDNDLPGLVHLDASYG
jgi:hypothetical protein